MGEAWDYFRMFVEYPFALRRFLKERLTVDKAQAIVRERMAQRDEHFLQCVERTIYRYPPSPYLALLKRAGCDLGDLRALVKQRGLENALCELREEGVYIGFEELKGRKPIVRNGLELDTNAHSFDNPFTSRHFSLPSSGSTGRAVTVGVNLENIGARMPDHLLLRKAQGLLGMPTIFWFGILPDFTSSTLIGNEYINSRPRMWFSQIGWRDSKRWLKYDVAQLYILLGLQMMGAQVPFPRIVRVDEALVIAQELVKMVRTEGRCHLHTHISRGLRVAIAAREAGLDLKGVTIHGGGEPITAAKVRAIKESGARFWGSYSTTETDGMLGAACINGVDPSDVHLLKDMFALVTFPHEVEGFDLRVPAFHVTSLLPTAPKVLLNAQLDDYGIVEERECGCELASYGFTTHLHKISSYSKLTGEGVTLIGTELVRVLEEVLPTRFGGGPLDYQIAEEEEAGGLTRLSLIIHPRVKIQDERAVIACVLTELRNSSAMADAAQVTWRDADTLRIVRKEPIWTGRGKFMPLHLARTE